jgi:hypothetical protein
LFLSGKLNNICQKHNHGKNKKKSSSKELAGKHLVRAGRGGLFFFKFVNQTLETQKKKKNNTLG